MKNIFDFTLDDLTVFMVEHGFSQFSAKQVFDWVYKKTNFNIDEWTNISKKCREFLKESIEFYLPKVIWDALSKDGTRKFLVQMKDNHTVETVVIASRDRLTQCISSQVGCAIGCTFCHTGTQGFTRHLTAGEIAGQYMAITLWLRNNVHPDERMSNIVFMGQGEPLHNYENVKKATTNFLNDRAFGLSQRKVTLSTSGLVPKIKMLHDFPPVNIAISLHSAIDDNRTELMPINKVYDLKRLFEAIKEIPLKAHRRITYEYLLIDSFNDRKEDIEALSNLLKIKESKINLIPFNEYPGSKYKKPSAKKVLWFMDQMCQRGYTCTVRATKGDDILAACGQLKTQYEQLNTWDNQIEVSRV
ncbi:MAG: 23S rRNA (adenine(2503)-C(2))-methyltransferase RlmN [Bacteriovoracaceae bacterium]|jgi:23S rRNA (adenine2503-C2)-methyltransferase|nr:23S rRNA (adenine(2503)-C(2))-methyltransferase RlmN [Bacteriovoracaceae bacterium]